MERKNSFLYATEQLDIHLNQLENIRHGVIGLSKVRRRGEREITRDGYKIIYSERQDGRHEQGVGMMLRKEATQALRGYESMGPRVTDFFEISRISRFMKGLKSASEVGKSILGHF